MINTLEQAEERSIVLIHGVAHNPCATDPTPEQWEALSNVFLEKKLYPLFDLAYQGFSSGDFD